jgi:putative copper resistance protein D
VPAVAVPAPSPWNLLVPAEWSVVGLAAVGIIGWRYISWVRRLTARHHRWPSGRTASFLVGLVVLWLAAFGGLTRYEGLLFSTHAAQHVLIGMLAPALLALGRPLTLALQAARPRTRARLRRALTHPVSRVLTNPVFAWALFSASLFLLYFTGLYELSLRNELVHSAVHAHFLLAGLLFATVVLGADALPTRVPHGARVLLVALTVPVHAILGVALLSSKEAVASDFYGAAARPDWCGPLLADQRTGAGFMWIGGELFGVVVAIIVAVQWMRHAEREARRQDRLLDASTSSPAVTR